MKRTVDELTPHRTESSTIHETSVAPSPAPTTGAESVLAELLADVVQVERVPVDSNFFTDLGADSMVMAQFCARVRKRADLPAVSMKDIYQHPTISSLAAALTDTAPAPVVTAQPISAARSSGISGSIATQACSWTSICSA